MAPVKVDLKKIRAFKDAASFYAWLAKNHDKADEIWVKIHKVNSGLKTITQKQAIDVVLCWGWIDGMSKGFDDKSYLQRFCPRGRKSTWSQINVGNVARLVEEGRMTEHGLKHVEAAKADGRWDRAYQAGKAMKISGGPSGRDRCRAEGEGDAREAHRAEPLFARVPHPQHEDGSGPKEEDRNFRRHAQARRDDPSAAQDLTCG